MTLTLLTKFFVFCDCLRVIHQYRHSTHIFFFQPRILSCGLGAQNYHGVLKFSKESDLCPTLMMNRESKTKLDGAMV